MVIWGVAVPVGGDTGGYPSCWQRGVATDSVFDRPPASPPGLLSLGAVR